MGLDERSRRIDAWAERKLRPPTPEVGRRRFKILVASLVLLGVALLVAAGTLTGDWNFWPSWGFVVGAILGLCYIWLRFKDRR